MDMWVLLAPVMQNDASIAANSRANTHAIASQGTYLTAAPKLAAPTLYHENADS